jgi:protein required for attachment to host cells
MYTVWILVANRAGARLFENLGPGLDLHLIETIDHPQGRLLDHEIDSDRQGTTHAPAGTRFHHVFDKSQDAADHEADVFARKLAHLVDEGRRRGQCSRIVLVAEPKFLGKLQAALPHESERHVAGAISKDWHFCDIKELKERLGQIDNLWNDVHRLDQPIRSTRVGER